MNLYGAQEKASQPRQTADFSRVSKVAYREFGLGLTFAAVAEEPVLWCHGSLRHVHGWSATTPDVGVALHKSLGGIREGLEGLVTAAAARSQRGYAMVRYFSVRLFIHDMT